ncbi:PaaI family thioesterase [Polymorphobacter sp.]|uniref:PaaI family thioesterase n=1 Tax=Polymorphobacter sp. TaxID=1909290 RepID=UPI003F6ECCE9
MTSLTLAQALHSQTSGSLDMLPYARLLAIGFTRPADTEDIELRMPFAERLIGTPGRLHGGTLAGLLELAALARVIVAQPADAPLPRIRPVTITVDFMREGAPVDTFAAGEITRLGRRIVNVSARAWQTGRDRPIAGAQVNFLLDYPAR